MRLLYFTDAHLADRPPSARTQKYADEIFDKLEECKEIAKSCDLSIFGGDLFHWPRPRDTSHALVRRTIEFLSDWPGLLQVVVGNHDQVPEMMAGFYRTPLGVVMEAMSRDVELMYSLTYQDVHFEAAHWTSERDTDPSVYKMHEAAHGPKRWDVKVVHAMCMPPGEYPFPCVTMDQIDTEADLVLLGHMHWQTPLTSYNGTMFVGPGALARTARTPGVVAPSIRSLGDEVHVAIVTFGEAPEPLVELRPLQRVKPASEVFAWVEEGVSPTVGLFDGYVAVLEAGLDVGGLSIEDALARLEKQAPVGVVEKARQYLREAGL